ncbi:MULTISPECIES: hypothetical protein [Actinomadura]|uniref:Extradiol ring-cleavage dioxygenase class III enzyme subunit B domain-containing protein n=1 Tax=Actinomadura yumaensis TaxID=111807 RepID=A0ABW2CPL7_9ACTN|nr:hypothetical protein [Actinomadura sp. J1-007]MWK36604.1 hypothetical protein [Actinomadura sp. J1-007]
MAADIVVAVGTSHGPQLKTPPERWGERAVFDRRNEALAFRRKDYAYADLAARREDFGPQTEPEAQRRRYEASQRALDELGGVVRAARPDVLVIVSSDHKEIFGDDSLPPFAVYWGETVGHVPFTQEHLDAMAPGLAAAAQGDVPDRPMERPCHPALATHVIKHTMRAGFDVSASKELPAGRYGNHGIPHGWGFVYQRILGQDCEIPMVPVFVNTFWEPNPPSARRCHRFGQALGAAIRSFPDGLRVGVVASGGLSHFVIDEDLDRAFIGALMDADDEYLCRLDGELLRSGTSELRNWITVAGALEGTGLRPRLVDYQPCYRTEAGTGNAMGFMAWEPEEGTT